MSMRLTWLPAGSSGGSFPIHAARGCSRQGLAEPSTASRTGEVKSRPLLPSMRTAGKTNEAASFQAAPSSSREAVPGVSGAAAGSPGEARFRHQLSPVPGRTASCRQLSNRASTTPITSAGKPTRPPGRLRTACSASPVRADLEGDPVLREDFQILWQDLLPIELAEDFLEHPLLHQPLHAHVDGEPLPVAFGQCPPRAAALRDMQDGIEHMKVVSVDVASLPGKEMGDALELLLDGCHALPCHMELPPAQAVPGTRRRALPMRPMAPAAYVHILAEAPDRPPRPGRRRAALGSRMSG